VGALRNGIGLPSAPTATITAEALVTGTTLPDVNRSASTSTLTVTLFSPVRTVCVKKLTMSPTWTGALKSMRSIAAVTHRWAPCRRASTNAAWSM